MCIFVDGWYSCVQRLVGDVLQDWHSRGYMRSHILSFSLFPISTHPFLLSDMKRITHKACRPYQTQCLPAEVRRPWQAFPEARSDVAKVSTKPF
jgi:hypothetical protein